MVYENCSDLTIALAILGGAVLYLSIGLLVGVIISSFTKNMSKGDKAFFLMTGRIFWPVAIIIMVIYGIALYLTFPFFAATREYVDDAEYRVKSMISRECSTFLDAFNGNELDIFTPSLPFKAGDIVTGIVPQTDKDGEVIAYSHLYQGCKCRVLSIKSNGSMEVILIGHKDKEAHANRLGDTFTAPARNFTKVKKVAIKRKLIKKHKVVRAKKARR